MICPKCSCSEVRVHGQRVHIDYVRRWGFFGRIVPRVAIRAFECSCGDCLFAFTVRPGGISEAPVQSAFNELQELGRQRAAAQRNGEEPKTPAPRNIARPAGDPRVKRR